jgi:uncharacterized membrane protein YuzA (DUF378 family)
MSSYIAKKVYALAILLLVIGGLAWGFIAAFKGANPVAKVFGKRAWIVYGLVGLAGLLVLWTGRNAFLPFLGPTIFPCAALEDRVPEGADTEVQVSVEPGAKVVYWASEPETDGLKELKDWRGAYGGFKNVGVATADQSGSVVLRVRKPQPYTVPTKSLDAHVHYRICMPDGELDEVKTVFLPGAKGAEGAEGAGATETEEFEAAKPLPATPLPAPAKPTPTPVVIVSSPPPPAVKQTTASPTGTKTGATTGAESPTRPTAGPEGFTDEVLYGNAGSTHNAATPLVSTVEAIDPRVARLRSVVESEVIESVDENAYDPLPPYEGTDLDLAFMEK